MKHMGVVIATSIDVDRRLLISADASSQPPSGVSALFEPKQPAEHARQLLTWLQSDGGRTGTISASELRAIHYDMCAELMWEVAPWVAVGREVRKLIRGKKEYVCVNGRRTCVYRIPVAK